jgi:hypothetical protein
LLIGLFAAPAFTAASLALVVAAMTAYLIRQPVMVAVKIYSGRRTRDELPAARFWMIVYGVILLLAIGELAVLHQTTILYLGAPAVPVFTWHLWLVSQRDERKQAGVEIIATGVLALAAPAALWVGRGSYDPWGWALWALAWFQSAASIVYAYLRLQQREWKSIPNRYERFRAGWRAFLYTSFNFFISAALSLGAGLLPKWIFIPFMVQWLEMLWGIDHPALGAKPVAIGMRQLIVSTLFTILFIITWRL